MPDREYFNSRRHNRRQQFIDLLGGKCERCGSKKNLHFDHKNPARKEFRIADRLDAPESVLKKEVRKCRLLCDKCHRDKTREKNEHGQPKARHGTIWYYKKYKCRCDKCREAMSEYNRNKSSADLILEWTGIFLKTATNGISAYTFVPKDTVESIKEFGLLPASKLIDNPKALKKAFPSEKERKKKVKETKEKLTDPEWKDIVSGISVFFTLPDWSKVPDKHFIFKNNLVPVEIKLSEFVKDNPDSKLLGVELEAFDPDLEDQPDRERTLSTKEIKNLSEQMPSELWEHYEGQTDKYAPDVPHLVIVTDSIAPKYLKL